MRDPVRAVEHYEERLTYFDQAVADGHLRITGPTGSDRVVYVAVNHSDRLTDPEERVRAEFWAELVYRYGYEPSRIGVEIIVPDRRPVDAADLVVFRDDSRTRPYAVIECKRDGISDAEFGQAIEQAAGNGTWAKFRASYVGVVAGSTRRFLDFTGRYGALEREANIVADLPVAYGRPEAFKFHKGGPLDIAPISREGLIQAIRKSHQTLWGGGKLSPPAAFGELSKVLFVKISDERAKRKAGEPYQFQIKTHESSRRLGERIRALYETQKEREPDVFTDTIKIDDATLRNVVSHLESVNLSETDLDIKGVAFEQFVDNFFKGDFGQYFTPRDLIQFAIDILQPTSDDIVLDPACGSGGFLLYALDAVRKEADAYHQADTPQHFRHWHDFGTRNLYGVEINDELTRVAKMNMIIHDDGHSNIVGSDALLPLSQLQQKNPGLSPGRFDLILTNPPFGAQVTLAQRPHLSTFELGRMPSKSGRDTPRKSQRTEVLFIERVWQFLKPGTGRAGIILPDGILTNASLQYVRDFLLERFQVLAVVSLPATAFSHFGAGVKSSFVFVRRRDEAERAEEDEDVFMAIADFVGYDATGRETDNDLPAIADLYHGHAVAG